CAEDEREREAHLRMLMTAAARATAVPPLAALIVAALTSAAGARIAAAQSAAQPARRVEWPAYGADLAATKYSTLADINRGNVASLAKAWEWSTGETPNDDPRT